MYRLVEILGDELIGLSSRYGRQLWATVKVRKQHRCQHCEELFPVGSKMYCPITNGYNRMHRLCEDCIKHLPQQIKEEAKGEKV